MIATDLLARLTTGGFTLTLDATGRLLVSPASRLTEDDQQAIRMNRDALVELLRGKAESAVMDAAVLRQVAAGAWATTGERWLAGSRYILLTRSPAGTSAGPG